jgi:DNA modification methylase
MPNAVLGLGDCLELMKKIPDGSVDMILCDLPYGTTACKWDVVIPFDSLWAEYERVIKRNGAIVLFGSEPFSSMLRASNLKAYKHDWIWKKSIPKGHLNAKKYPLKLYETVSVFCKGVTPYFPQFWESKPMNSVYSRGGNGKDSTYGKMNKIAATEQNSTKRYPVDVIAFSELPGNAKERVHPTQKPVALLEYLIKTYTNEGELVLDNTMGSGSTGVAAANLNRNFIGIEKEAKYFEIAVDRILKAQPNTNVELFE